MILEGLEERVVLNGAPPMPWTITVHSTGDEATPTDSVPDDE